MFKNFRKKIANFINPVKNAISIGNQFLKYGTKRMLPGWSHVEMSDADFYTGYSYAAIRNRANATAQTAINNIKTESNKEDLVHPYLDLINQSTLFSVYKFWSDICTYLDLEGIYYLMAIRNTNTNEGGSLGDIQEFKLLNPYNIKRVVKFNNETKMFEVKGYVENSGGYQRDIPKEMIVEIKELNPFKPLENFAMTDAAKESQFTLKTSGDYTRNALKHNINAPGIMSTDVILPTNEFKNFMERVKNHTKGEPVFGNGKGAITWESMNVELSKAALKDTNEISRDQLLSTSGLSKTLMGIEQSGTTRETAKVQTALFISNHIIPRVQLIIDSLNLDYRNSYPKEFAASEATIGVSNPTAVDSDADIKKTDSLQKNSDLYNELLEKGYSADTAAQYVTGEIGVDQLGEPTPPEPEEPEEKEPPETEENRSCGHHTNKKEVAEEGKGTVQQQEGALKNAILNIDQEIVAEAIAKVEATIKNEFDARTDLISKSSIKRFINELEAVLIGFYGIVMTFEGSKTMRKRMSKFAMIGTFKLNRDSNKYIKKVSEKVAISHIDTIITDVWKTAREEALKGVGQRQIVNAIKEKYAGVIAETRVKTIARTETNRAFTMAQFDADRQFIKQNKLEGKVFKQWKTRSDNPCPFCQALEDEGPVPFNTNFRNLGDDVNVDGKTLDIDFEPLVAGNAHPNCGCIYELIIVTDNSMEEVNRIKNEFKEKKLELEKQINEIEDLF